MPETTQETAVQLCVYHASDGFEALHQEWDALLATNPVNEVFLTWEWQSTWWEAYHPGDLWLIAGRDTAGTLIGIASWFVEQPSRTLRSVGCVDVTDYCDLLVSPDQQTVFYEALCEFLAAQAAEFDSISFCNIPTRSPTLDTFASVLGKHDFAVEVVDQEICPVIDLPDTFDKFVESLDKKNRHELRRKMRRAEEGDDEVAWYFVDSADNLADETECFLELMAASQVEKAEFLQNPQHQAFFRAIIPQLARRGWLKLSFLTVNDVRAASYFSIDYGNRIGLYNSGILPQGYGHLSPGIVLLAYIIGDAIIQKRDVFDFLRGNQDYKYRMGAHETKVMELCARRGTPIPSTTESN